jgi:tetratricopeptide (TPR) repeat protein
MKGTVASLAVLLGACAAMRTDDRPASAPPPAARPIEAPAAALSTLEAGYRQRATALAHAGRWAEARPLWEVLVLLDPASAEYRAQLDLAQTRMTELAAERLKAADKARQGGDLDQATLAYLRVLSADPANDAAARALRELEAERVKRAFLSRPPRVNLAAMRAAAGQNAARGRAAATTEVGGDLELGVMLFKQGDHAGSVQSLERHLQKHPKDEEARVYLADAYQQLGAASLKSGRKESALGYLEKAQRLGAPDPGELNDTIRSLRRALGDEYYRLGVQTFPSSIDKAIALWERSLQFDPGQTQAQIRLQQARRAQETLRSIDRGTKH